jgi:hypothetical protein
MPVKKKLRHCLKFIYDPGNRRLILNIQTISQKRRATARDGCDVVISRTITPDGPRSPEIHPSQVVVRRRKVGTAFLPRITCTY